MSEKKPGLIRRIFRFIGSVVSAIRYMISLVVVLFFIAIIGGMFVDDIQPMPERGALYLAPSGTLVDQRSYIDPVSEIFAQPGQRDTETLVRDIVQALDHAQYDERITHVLLDTNYMAGGSIAKLEEISGALQRFKRSGKPIVAIGDNFSQSQYFLAAHADEIIMNPLGRVMLTGFGSYSNYYKEALDKLKINVHVFRVGKYKSAVEPFLGKGMSDEARADRRDLVDSLWQFYTSRVEQLRGLPNGALNDLANNIHLRLAEENGDIAALALQQGLIDRIATRSETKAHLLEILPQSNGEFDSVPMAAYLNHMKLGSLKAVNKGRPEIAVVVASGAILDGNQPEGTVGGDTLAEMFAAIEDEDQVKAVVLRVDSPGGSAFASDVIRDSIASLRKRNIPVVISMGSYAASGGYWIATESDKIVALSTTITGSIGVFGVIPTFEDSLSAMGVYSDGVGTTNIAGMLQLSRAMTPETKMIMQSGVEHVYSRFLNLVADARETTPSAIHEIAQGRVWTGKKALELGLVDALGDLNDAIASAAILAGVSDYKINYRRKPLSFMEQVMMEISGNVDAAVGAMGLQSWLPMSLQRQLASALKPLQFLDALNDPNHVYLYCESCPL
ncbi:signal peptide peptidase SppA [SAR92 clade bacterium H455]|uniref:Signal peptide peptidase SppA n=1 Tax=SAR92 clade bacterium H455 TaxID=2974818 RepID=A0ABY5TNR0_9GAMM|nr:signal peptide peptidase SppA [SAR92 clade bacterium H455]